MFTRHVHSSTHAVGKGVALPPLPPRCRNGVNSPYFPVCVFHASGDPRQRSKPGSKAPLPDRMNLPCEESVNSSLSWNGQRPFLLPAKAHQAQQPKPLKLLNPEPPVIMEAEPLVFHAAQAPPNPGIQFLEKPPVSLTSPLIFKKPSKSDVLAQNVASNIFSSGFTDGLRTCKV